MVVALAIVAGCACILGSYHLGYSAGLKEAAHMTEECMNMALDCIKEGQDALTSKLE
jgi:hypothetical protein